MGTWGELDGSETCGELWGGLNWFRLRLGREDSPNAFTIIYLTNPIQCTYATLQLLHRFNHCGGPIRSPKSHGLSALFRLSPFPSLDGASTRAAKAFEAFKRGKSAAIASPGEVRFQEPMFCEKTLEESSHKINLKKDKSHENYSYLCIINIHKP